MKMTQDRRVKLEYDDTLCINDKENTRNHVCIAFIYSGDDDRHTTSSTSAATAPLQQAKRQRRAYVLTPLIFGLYDPACGK
jgi:hypothetical protein